MSHVVAFRERIMQGIADAVPDLNEINWYDGIFDEHDLTEWSHKTPAAYVSVLTAPSHHHSTGELNVDLRCVVVIIDADTRDVRDADSRIWSLCEQVSVLANQNSFGDPRAGCATKIKFQRLVHPELRREGVAVGIVEWESTLAIGVNRVLERDFIWHNGQMVTQTPKDDFLGYATPIRDGVRGPREGADLTPPDPAYSGDSEEAP